MAEQAVIVHLPLSDDRFGSSEEQQAHFALQEKVAEAIDDAEAGEFDGDEIGQGEWVLYMYGANADKLFSAIQPVLESSPLAAGGYAIKRYGEAADRDARECRVSLQ